MLLLLILGSIITYVFYYILSSEWIEGTDDCWCKTNYLNKDYFPLVAETEELLLFSSLVYTFRAVDAVNCSSASNIFANNSISQFYTCHLYERDEQDTQVLIASSRTRNQIVVAFAGTDDLKNALTDGDILMEPFGPSASKYLRPSSPNDTIRVHAGFNHAVFDNGLFDRILETILQVRSTSCISCSMYTTGHSLGAANSILTAVALTQYFADSSVYSSPQRQLLHQLPQSSFIQQELPFITNINFGCPKTGNRAWGKYVNNLPTLRTWRFVNGWDLIPRLPDARFVHVGHTIQLNRNSAKAYWLHHGDDTLGFKGVPIGWSAFAFMVAPGAAYQHLISNYQYYFLQKSSKDPTKFYVHDFERVTDKTDDYYGNSSRGFDDDVKPPNMKEDQDDREIASDYVIDYYKILHGQR